MKMPGAYSEMPHLHRLASKAIFVLRGIGLENGSPKAEEVQIRKINRKMSTQRRQYYQRWALHDLFVTKFCCCEKIFLHANASDIFIFGVRFCTDSVSYETNSKILLHSHFTYICNVERDFSSTFVRLAFGIDLLHELNRDAKSEDVEKIANVSKKSTYPYATFKIRFFPCIVLQLIMYEGDTSLETLSTTENNLRDRKSYRRRRFLTLYGMRIPQYGTQSTANTLISRAYTYRNRLRLIFFEFTFRVDPIRDPLPSLHSEDLEKIVETSFPHF